MAKVILVANHNENTITLKCTEDVKGCFHEMLKELFLLPYLKAEHSKEANLAVIKMDVSNEEAITFGDAIQKYILTGVANSQTMNQN